LKDVMGLDVEHDVQIPRRPAALAGFAVAGRTKARAGVHSGRDAQFNSGNALAAASAATDLARFLDDAPGALTMRTGLGDAENAARADHLAAAAASRANPGARAGFGAGTLAVV